MASIALSGTGTDKKVVINTVDGVKKVSCTCCGCARYRPTETKPGASIVISGVTSCSFPFGNGEEEVVVPDINGSYDLEYVDGYGWFYSGTVGSAQDFYIQLACFEKTDTEPAYLQLQITATIVLDGAFQVIYFQATSDLTESPAFNNSLSCDPNFLIGGGGGSATITFQ